jgi:hypothetical protein
MSTAGEHVTITEIADLIAWARHVSDVLDATSPAERAAFHAAKADLLSRIDDQQHAAHAEHPNPREDIG